MGTQGKNSALANSMQRVKVYRLNDDGKWNDRGTGHVTVDYIERSEDLGLYVIDEEDNETLLVHRISSEEIYRRQEDTIIAWRDQELSTELALSFQESMGCSYIWDHICNVQRNMQFNTLGNLEIGTRPSTSNLEASGMSQVNDEPFHSVNSESRELPPIELSNLPVIIKRVKVYSLNDDGKWDDRGTGHVTVDYIERSEDLGLYVIDEEDNETLLVHRISSEEIYRRQEDTIIAWGDQELSTELALSFQESMGCSYIWDHICNVQRNMQFNTLGNLEIGT